MNSPQRDNQHNNTAHFSQHHSFDINLACQYGVQEALLITHFIFWISHNKRLKRNFKDGRYWMYQTQEEMVAHFPYLSRKQIMRILDRLVEKGVIIKGNYNKLAMDHTTWYAFKDDSFLNNFYDCPKVEQSEVPEWDNQCPKVGQSIPDTKTTDTITKTTTTTEPDKEAVAVASFQDEILKGLPLTPAEQASFALQFTNDQLKHMVSYYHGRMSVNPEFKPESWASYLAKATREGYAVPCKTQVTAQENKINTFEKNKELATKFYEHFQNKIPKGSILFLHKEAIEYKDPKGGIYRTSFNSYDFDVDLGSILHFIKNPRE
jgi:hypothetical protein